MRKIILLAAACCLLQFTFAEGIFSSTSLNQHSLIVQPQTKIVSDNNVHKRRTLKEKLLLKWYKRKIYTQQEEETEKKSIKILSLLSVLASLFGPITVLLAFTSATPGIFVTTGILFCVAAIILGIVALKKIKNLHDKNGISKAPALTGIIVAGLFILALLSLFAFVNF